MPSERAPTSDRLRRDIDSGRTADKVDFPDPAAAPLGADDEAAGRPPTAARREAAVRAETTREAEPRRGGGFARAAVAFVTVVALALLAWILWRR